MLIGDRVARSKNMKRLDEAGRCRRRLCGELKDIEDLEG